MTTPIPRTTIPLTPIATLPVSAASGLVAVGDQFWTVADDETVLVGSGARGDWAERIELVPDRLPEDHAARKRVKPDFEAIALLPDGRVLLAMAWNVSIGGREDINNVVGMGEAPNWWSKAENGELRIDSGTKWNGTHYYYVMRLPTRARPDVLEGRWITDTHPQPLVLHRKKER